MLHEGTSTMLMLRALQGCPVHGQLLVTAFITWRVPLTNSVNVFGFAELPPEIEVGERLPRMFIVSLKPHTCRNINGDNPQNSFEVNFQKRIRLSMQ